MTREQDRRPIHSERAPQAIGPYSQAVRIGNQLFCSGQIALEPDTGELVEGGIAEQATRVLDNLEAVVAAAGMTMADVVKVTIYVTDMADFAELNRIYGERFTAPYPARATVAVAALPKDALVEMDVVAVARC